MRNCYTYFAKFTHRVTAAVVWYYGSKSAHGCDPSQLGTIYAGSSKYVDAIMDAGEHDVEWFVHRVFGADFKNCKAYEGAIIHWLQAHKSPTWLNRHDPRTGNFGMTGINQREDTKAKIAASHIGKKHTEDTKLKMSKIRSGKKFGPLSEEHRKTIAAANAKPFSLMSPEGVRVDGVNLKSFCFENNLNFSTMAKIAKGYRKKGRQGWTAVKESPL